MIHHPWLHYEINDCEILKLLQFKNKSLPLPVVCYYIYITQKWHENLLFHSYTKVKSRLLSSKQLQFHLSKSVFSIYLSFPTSIGLEMKQLHGLCHNNCYIVKLKCLWFVRRVHWNVFQVTGNWCTNSASSTYRSHSNMCLIKIRLTNE